MSRREHAFERLQAADPYPPTVDVTARESAPPLLEATIERRENMQTQEVEPTTATAPRRRRAALGLAVVLVVAAVGAGLWVTSHGDEPFDTAAADDVDVVTEFFDRLDAGDPPGALALVSDSPAIKITMPMVENQLGQEGLLDFFAFYVGTLGTTDLNDCAVSAESVVSCRATQTSDFWGLLGNQPVSGLMTVTIRDSRVQLVAWTFTDTDIGEMRGRVAEYAAWIAEYHPDQIGSAVTQSGDLVTTEASAELHLELVREFSSEG